MVFYGSRQYYDPPSEPLYSTNQSPCQELACISCRRRRVQLFIVRNLLGVSNATENIPDSRQLSYNHSFFSGFFIFAVNLRGAIYQYQLFIPYRFGKSKGFKSSKSESALGDQRQSTANGSARFSAPNLGSAVVIRSGNTPRYPPRASHHVRDAGRFLFSVAVGKK